MNRHVANKLKLAAFLDEVASADAPALQRALSRHCADSVQWEIFHPFNSLSGTDEAIETFWAPLTRAFPDYEARIGMMLAGEYRGEDWVSLQGHLLGSFIEPWLGIPPTHGLTMLRFGLNAAIQDGRLTRVYILLDILDVMRQAGLYPFRRMPGSAEQWPLPPLTSFEPIDGYQAEQGAVTLRAVREMQAGLGHADEEAAFGQYLSLEQHARLYAHSPHWHMNMNWYGPAGIGSTRGERGFMDFHCALFLQAFPDRSGSEDQSNNPDAPHHYIQLGDGRFGVTSGWPSLEATHVGGQWLGLPPTGRKVDMRVADWYRVDADDLLIDNWVMIDVPYMLHQMGLDVLSDLRHVADPRIGRWPVTTGTAIAPDQTTSDA
jgi:hypothetical protein